MNNLRNRKLSPFKLVTGLIASAAAIGLCIYLIQDALYKKQPIYPYFILIFIACLFLFGILKTYIIQHKQK